MGQKINPVGFRQQLSRSFDFFWTVSKSSNFSLFFQKERGIRNFIVFFFKSFSIFLAFVVGRQNKNFFFIYCLLWKQTDVPFGNSSVFYKIFCNQNNKEEIYQFFFCYSNVLFPFFFKSFLLYSKFFLKKNLFLWIVSVHSSDLCRSVHVVTRFLTSRLFFSKNFDNNKFNVLVRTVLDYLLLDSFFKGVRIVGSGRNKQGQTIAHKEVFNIGSLSIQTLDSKIEFEKSSFLGKLGLFGIKIWVAFLFF